LTKKRGLFGLRRDTRRDKINKVIINKLYRGDCRFYRDEIVRIELLK
jgi:hypothetical protein